MLKKNLASQKEGMLNRFSYLAGRLGGQEVILAMTGVGKTNTALISALFISKFAPEKLIYTGTAARINRELRTGDIILGKKTVHHDCGTLGKEGMIYRKIIGPLPNEPTNYQFAANSSLLALASAAAKSYRPKAITANGSSYIPEVRTGIICSGDLFGMTDVKITDIRAKLKADLVEMEGSVVGQVCTCLRVPHLVIRAGSNLAQEAPGNDYKRLGQTAALSAASFTLHFMRYLSGGVA